MLFRSSFMELFAGDHEKCKALDKKIAQKMGFEGCYAVSGQTYSRKIDSRILNVLAGVAQSTHKFSNDIRLLQHMKEVEEPLAVTYLAVRGEVNVVDFIALEALRVFLPSLYDTIRSNPDRFSGHTPDILNAGTKRSNTEFQFHDAWRNSLPERLCRLCV